MMNNTLAERIQHARTASQLSVMEVSRLIAVKPDTYKHWESGSSEPRINKLTTLAGVLAVSPGWLLTGDSEQLGVMTAEEQVAMFRTRIQQLTAIQSRVQVMLDELSCDLDDFTEAGAEFSAEEE